MKEMFDTINLKIEVELMKDIADELQKRIDKAIEYITSEEYYDLNNKKTGSFSKDSKNYFIAHDKLLNILQNGDDEE